MFEVRRPNHHANVLTSTRRETTTQHSWILWLKPFRYLKSEIALMMSLAMPLDLLALLFICAWATIFAGGYYCIASLCVSFPGRCGACCRPDGQGARSEVVVRLKAAAEHWVSAAYAVTVITSSWLLVMSGIVINQFMEHVVCVCWVIVRLPLSALLCAFPFRLLQRPWRRALTSTSTSALPTRTKPVSSCKL